MTLVHLLSMMTLERAKFTFVSQSASWFCRNSATSIKLMKLDQLQLVKASDKVNH